MFYKKFSYIFSFLLSISSINASEGSFPSNVTSLDDAQFENFIQKAEKPVIVDFWAPWCRPCRELKPIFVELANELHAQYHFVSVDIDQGSQIAEKYGIEAIPTIIIVNNGIVLGKFNGRAEKEILAKNIDNAIHQKLTLETLFSAIHHNDKELVAACLENETIDVNGILQFGKRSPNSWTPLLLSVSKFIRGETDFEIISMLLQKGALVDMEIESPLFDKKTKTIRLLIEEIAQQSCPENLDEGFQEKIIEMTKKASSLLELFPPKV
ncbi:MAG: thioredoxin [Candidatus Protochlamydia sp.]|nr:thioredoxin [Candidatus Protochlamydia sp.]